MPRGPHLKARPNYPCDADVWSGVRVGRVLPDPRTAQGPDSRHALPFVLDLAERQRRGKVHLERYFPRLHSFKDSSVGGSLLEASDFGRELPHCWLIVLFREFSCLINNERCTGFDFHDGRR